MSNSPYLRRIFRETVSFLLRAARCTFGVEITRWSTDQLITRRLRVSNSQCLKKKKEKKNQFLRDKYYSRSVLIVGNFAQVPCGLAWSSVRLTRLLRPFTDRSQVLSRARNSIFWDDDSKVRLRKQETHYHNWKHRYVKYLINFFLFQENEPLSLRKKISKSIQKILMILPVRLDDSFALRKTCGTKLPGNYSCAINSRRRRRRRGFVEEQNTV